jgi:DNA-directed RNA polymerase subunit L/DNA-directed RNA polymerase alpha subunit
MEQVGIKFTNKDIYNLQFDISNIHPSLANGIRRTILDEVETLGFKTEPFEESDIKIIENTSSLHNEFLLHRIGMIPIYYPNLDKYDTDEFRFILDVSNDGSTNILNVTTNDFKIVKTNKKVSNNPDVYEDSETFFPINSETGEYILITKLKSNPSGGGEKIKLEGKAMKGSGKMNARWSPVSCVVFNNKRDPEKNADALQQYIAKSQESKDTKLTGEEVAVLTKRFNLLDADRYFMTDKNDNPNVFEFTIESIGSLKSSYILINSIFILNTKITKFMLEFRKAIKSQSDMITIAKSDTILNAFDITIQNETHTLGNLLQSYVLELYPEISFAGYLQPHPLKDHIVLRIGVDDNNIDTVTSILEKICDHIKLLCTQIRDTVSKELNIQSTNLKLVRKKSGKPESKALGK